MIQLKRIEAVETDSDREMADDLKLLVRLASRMAGRAGDEPVASCLTLALHLLGERERRDAWHDGQAPSRQGGPHLTLERR